MRSQSRVSPLVNSKCRFDSLSRVRSTCSLQCSTCCSQYWYSGYSRSGSLVPACSRLTHVNDRRSYEAFSCHRLAYCFDFRQGKPPVTTSKIKSTEIRRPRMLAVPLYSPSPLPLKQAGVLFAFWSHPPDRSLPRTLQHPRLDAVLDSFWALGSLSSRPVADLRSMRLVLSLHSSTSTARCASAHGMVCSRP